MRLQQADVQVNVGAISGVTLKEYFVSPLETSIHSRCRTVEPFSRATNDVLRSGRNDGCCRFTYFIRVFIQRESEHFNAAGVCLA